MMGKKKVKVVLLWLVAILSLGALSACDQTSDAAEVELRVFIGQPRLREQYEAHFDRFIEQMREEGVEVTITLEMPSDNESSSILQTRIASGDAPDVFSFHPGFEAPLYADAGWLADLSDEPFVDLLFDAARNYVTQDGMVIGVPLEGVRWGYLFNREIFADLGLELPQTITEMRHVVDVLHANDITPFVLSYQEGWIPQLFLSLTMGGLIETIYPNFVESMNNDESSFAVMSQMFEIMDLVNANGTERPFEVGADQGAADFANGLAAMYVQGPWMSDSILAVNPDIDFGVAPLPVSDDSAGTMINSSFSLALGVSSDSPNQEMARRLVNFILDEEYSSQFFESLGFNALATVHHFEPHPWLREADEFVAQGRTYMDPRIPSAVRTESERAFQSYFAGDWTQEEVIEALDRAWEQFNRIHGE